MQRMTRSALLCWAFIGCIFSSLSTSAQDNRYSHVPYSVPSQPWDRDSLGNHRAVINLDNDAAIAHVYLEWRRRDKNPCDKKIIIESATKHQLVKNYSIENCSAEGVDIYFKPLSGEQRYNVYYMPYKNEGRSNYPRGVYLAAADNSNSSWLQGEKPAGIKTNAHVETIQSVDAFNSFYPMEVVATGKEVQGLVKKYGNKGYIIFPESREYPIRMKEHLPMKWILNAPATYLKGTADKGEYFALQLGVYALENLDNAKVVFTDLADDKGNIISKKLISCVNTDGTDYKGYPLKRVVNIEKGKVQPLWCGIDIPVNTKAGIYKGTAIVQADDHTPSTIDLSIEVTNQVAINGGANQPQLQTRLKWLNSTLAQENEVIKPYTPLLVKGNSIDLLGRKITLGKDGLPSMIQTYFKPEMTSIGSKANNLLASAFEFNVKNARDEVLTWKSSGVHFTKKEAGTVSWTATNTAAGMKMNIQASMEFDGHLSYQVQVIALVNQDISDIQLRIPFAKEMAKYMMGLQLKGSKRPATYDWKWDVAHKNQDGAWIGNVNAGLQFSLRDEHYRRPLNTNFYLQQPLLLPTSWGNNNKGGISVAEDDNKVWVNNYSGARTMNAGDTLYYNFDLLITPFHPINTDFQWTHRFYHKYDNIDSIKAKGANVINIHHATPINPWINYPFIEHAKMKAYIDEAHQKGLQVKIYNTVRELSNHAYETFPLRSLNHEIYSHGKGGGYSWLQEHIGEDYIAAWFVPEIKDAAIVNSGMSRWHNYYVEGMNWLVQNVGIDGIYLDDVAFDRVTMKRIKRVLTKDGHPGIIDLHSANQYNKSDGFQNSANLYMEHFPYLNRLWFGEYFDYEHNSPEFFLTEVSGIPFGLMGEMLQDGGNLWRGMVFGMTNRLPWSAEADPRPIWKLWDTFGIVGSEMLGYWLENNPVKTSDPAVLATVYKKKGKALVALASWKEQAVDVSLEIDWKTLGIDPKKASIKALPVKNFQEGRLFKVGETIPVQPARGWLLIIE